MSVTVCVQHIKRQAKFIFVKLTTTNDQVALQMQNIEIWLLYKKYV